MPFKSPAVRRVSTRVALLFAVAAAVTCSDGGITGPGRALRALIGVAPTFSKNAAEVLQSLEAFSLAVDNIHVVLQRADGSVAIDTVVQLDGRDSVSIALSVPVNGLTENFVAHVELRDGSTVLFSGDQSVVANKSGLPSAPPPPLTVNYTGPGASVTSLDFAPGDTTMFATDSLRLRPVALNSSGQLVTNLAIVWSVKDAAIGSVSATGVFKPAGPRGETYVVGRIPTGVRDSALIHVLPPATHAVLVTGGGQTGTAGLKLAQPVVVELQAADNLPVPGVPVAIAVASGGGSVSTSSALTDANGRVAFDWTLGVTAGTNSAVVSAPGITSLTILATGVAGVPAAIAAGSSLAIVDTAGANLSAEVLPAVMVKDANNNPVPAAQVTFRRHGGTGSSLNTLADTMVTVATGADGKAALTNRRLQQTAGLDTVLASVSGVKDTLRFVAKATNAHPHHLAFQQQPTSTSATTLIPVAVKVLDQFNNVNVVGDGATLPITLSFADNIAVPAGAVLGPSADSTTKHAVSGLAEFHVNVNVAPSTYAITASSGSLTNAVSNNFTISLGSPAFVVVDSGDGQGAMLSDSLPQLLVARVLDAGSNKLPGINVSFIVDSGGGLAYTSTTTTDANGRARSAWRVGSAAGLPQVARAAVSTNLFAKFRAFMAETLVVVQQPTLDPQNRVVFAQQPIVQLRDLAGHQVKRAGVTVEAFATPGVTAPDNTVQGDTLVDTDAEGNARYQRLAIAGAVQSLKLQFAHFAGAPETTVVRYAESQQLILRAGPAATLVQTDTTVHVYTVAGGSELRVKVLDSDANVVSNESVTFQLLQSSGCSVGATSTSGSDGVAVTTVSRTGSYASCVVKATLTNPPPSRGICEVTCPTPSVIDRTFLAPAGTATWLGGTYPNFWGDAANWSTRSAPTPSTDVYLPIAAFATPNTYSDTGVVWHTYAHSITADRGVSIQQYSGLQDDTLHVHGSFSVDTVYGNGVIWIAPNGIDASQTARGFVYGSLLVGNDPTRAPCATPSNSLLLSDSLGGRTVVLACKVALNKNVLHVSDGGLTTTQLGGIVMNTAADVAVVDGPAQFSGQGSVLTAGTMYFRGNFTVIGDANTAVFNASPTHESIFDGVGAQEIKFSNPLPDFQQFGRLTIANVVNGVSLLQYAPALSAPFTIPPATLVLRDKAKFTLGADGAAALIFSPTVTLGSQSVLTVWGNMRGVTSCTMRADATITPMGTGTAPPCTVVP